MNAIKNYIDEAVTELRKVRWPTRNQAIRLSLIVIAFTAVCSMALGILDVVLNNLISLLISLR